MPLSPKYSKEKVDRIAQAWATLASGKSFGGMTLANFQAYVDDAVAARTAIRELEDQLKQALAVRDNFDYAAWEKALLAVAGVVADPSEGDDSALYEAMGYVRKSQKKSGLTRKKKNPVD